MIIKDNSLPPNVLKIIRHQATEKPYTGHDENTFHPGTYLCRGCGIALFRSYAKFNAGCGWPSFDEALEKAVTERLDPDELRTEIICTRCTAHLGHVFTGEGFTTRNIRHCVNSNALDFVEDTLVLDTEEAIIAGGCFWGVEYYLKKLTGVLRTEVGYTGGETAYPSYGEVCAGHTGHYEAVRVIYSPSQLDYETILRYFFEIHDPTQYDGQGPDRGHQYKSAIFYYIDAQKQIAEKLMTILKQDRPVATQLLPVTPFWPAEPDHQQYYAKTVHQPYCHAYIRRFKD
jgi:peptide methionine sulfoxide reductase msrA/msrB